MNVSLFISAASITCALLCSGFAFTLARGPGWADLRWFGWVCLTSAGYVAGTLPENGVGPEAWVPIGSSLALTAGAGHVTSWFHYVAALERRELGRFERACTALLAVCAVVACVPGALLQMPVVLRDNGWFPGQHRDPTPTLLGWAAFLLYFAIFVLLVVRMYRAHRRGVPHVLGPAVGLTMVLVAMTSDTAASSHAYIAPSILELAMIGLVASVLIGVTARVTEASHELHASQRALEHTQQELLERERLAALGELSAVIAHEVRNPLGVIYGAVATLQRTVGPNADERAALDIVREEAQRLNRLVEDLLRFARPHAPLLETVGTEGLLSMAMSLALRTEGFAESAVELSVKEDAAQLECDPSLLMHAITNLVMNGLQADGRKGPVKVEAHRSNGHVEIAVSDDGRGVATAEVDKLFTPFFTTRPKGTGLGLALVEKIAKSHGGVVRYQPTDGGGATFVIELPRARPATA